MDSAEYETGIEAIAREVLSDIERGVEQSQAIAENIDQHRWLIYTAETLAVLTHSNNDAAYWEEGVGGLESAGSPDKVYQILAYWAMDADVREKLEEIRADSEDESDDSEES